MAKKRNSELRFVLPLVGGCLAAIIGFHWAYWDEFVMLTRDAFFLVVYIVLTLGFLLAAYYAFKLRDTAKDNATRWVTAIVAAILCIWVGAWCGQYRADKSDNIEYKYSK